MKKPTPQRTLAIIGRLTSFLGFVGSLLLAKLVMFDAEEPNHWAGFGIVLLGVAFANKFTGAELAGIFHEIAGLYSTKKLGERDRPRLPFDDDGTDNDPEA